MSNLTMGSLFDGSGGFPLGGLLCGITPMWASEIEPFPIRVTTKRLPFMKHYGDVSKMNGAELSPVDIITFGSPCQDMSIAGKRAGLGGSRSNLFYEAIRIVKEMRCKTNGKYPRFIVWENVPGAFSSNKGEDFRAVLESVCSVKDTDLSVPEPPKGKWQTAGEIMADDYSVAWRTFDAQFWGVPQRRRRIYLVADFGGYTASKILFESEGLSGYSAESRKPWQRAASDAEGSSSPSSGKPCAVGFEPGAMSRLGGYFDVELTGTLRADMGDNQTCVAIMGKRQRGLPVYEDTAPCLLGSDYKGSSCVFENHSQDTCYTRPIETAQTVLATYGTGGNNQPFVVETPKTLKIRSSCEGGGKGALIQDNKSATLGCNNDQTLFEPKAWGGSDISPTLTANNAGGNQRMPGKENFNCVLQPFGICSDGSNSMKSDNPNSGIYEAETARTIDANGGNPGCNQGGMAIVESYALQGSMIGRKDENGPNGSGINKDVSFTLDATDKHAVVYALDRASYNQGENAQLDISVKDDGTAQTVLAKGPGAVASFYPQMKAESQCYREDDISNTLVNGTNPGFQNGIVEPEYTVRRLTPLECCRLQGFPDFWCSELRTENPTEDDISFWTDVFETHRIIMGTSTKPKSRKAIVKWLKNPNCDSAEYKMWGNGVALPNVCYVLGAIAYWCNKSQV